MKQRKVGAAVEALTLASSQKGRWYCATKTLQLCYKSAAKVLQLCYKGATTVLQRCYNSLLCASQTLLVVCPKNWQLGVDTMWTHSFNCLVDLIESLHANKLANSAYLAPKFLSQVSKGSSAEDRWRSHLNFCQPTMEGIYLEAAQFSKNKNIQQGVLERFGGRWT